MAYQIADEPQATELSQFVVQPSAPLIAAMMCGAWLSWPWFAFNAFAMGSPTKKKELALCGAAFAGTAVLAMILIALVRGEIIESTLWIRIALLAIVTYKLSITYYICSVQSRTFHVYQYYGGTVRAATYVLSLGYMLRSIVIGVSDDPLWIIVVTGLL
jgi:hypothetical protein